MEGCIFCKIIAKEVPAALIYEDDFFVAMLDIGPVHQGHTLVIPKDHHATFLDMPDDLAKDYAHVIKVLSPAIMESMGAQGVNITTNVGSAAGQTVHHAHFHIIPRFKGDGLQHWPQKEYEEGEMDKIVESIKKHL